MLLNRLTIYILFLCSVLLGCGGGNSQDSNENKELDEVTLPLLLKKLNLNYVLS